MKNKKTLKYETMLLKMKSDLLNFPTSEIDSDSSGGDEADQATSLMQLETERAEKARVIRELINISDALKKISSGDYGTCAECEEKIEDKRLKANPTASLCVACQEAKEIKDRRTVKSDVAKNSLYFKQLRTSGDDSTPEDKKLKDVLKRGDRKVWQDGE